MRLTRKFVLVLTVGIMLVLGINAFVRVQREVELFDEDTRRDADLMGAVLAHDVAYAWRTEGERAALSLLQDVAKKSRRVRVRFVWLDAAASGGAVSGAAAASGGLVPDVALSQLDPVLRGWTLSRRIAAADPPDDALYTYVPVAAPGARRGAVELRESLRDERHYVSATIRSTIVATLLLILTCAAIASILGTLFVGRPTRKLVEKVRRIGGGDLSEPLHLAQRDELGEIAGEVNAMCERLALADQRVRKETDDRIAAVQQLRHADRLMTVGKLASGLAHELGTPLNVVSGRAQMIVSRESRGAEAEDDARIIVEQARRMTNIIRQLLDFARPKTSQRTLLDLRATAQQTVELLAPLGQKRGVELTLAPGFSVYARVDGTQLQQVLSNLIVNAIHASAEGGHVELALVRELASVPSEVESSRPSMPIWCAVIRVTDDGHGMDEVTQARIFEPFFTTKDVGDGTGLGLAVTHGIVREHGGFVQVESEVGKGSRFSVYLPAAEESKT